MRYIIKSIGLLMILLAMFFFTNVRKAKAPQSSGNSSDPVFASSYIDDLISGKDLYQEKCQHCHNIFKTDDFFSGGLQNEFWTGSKKVASFLRQPEDFAREEYIAGMMRTYGMKIPHVPFRDITDEQVAKIYLFVLKEVRSREH